MIEKRNNFWIHLKKKLSIIDLGKHPEVILKSLTHATQSAIDKCFPLKTKSNRAKKRSLTPWYDTKIFEGEKKTEKTFSKIFADPKCK